MVTDSSFTVSQIFFLIFHMMERISIKLLYGIREKQLYKLSIYYTMRLNVIINIKIMLLYKTGYIL